ncbi:MAG TPA: zf-HC2 domain-containing protein [Pyrinomonadaceae bacterium]
MKCTRVEKFLPLHVAGDLAGRRRERAVEQHLADCAKCRLAAAEYQASRELFRAAALSPDFDGAFYEEIRNSVLARITRDRTPVPPSGFFRLFDTRLAYAASLALLLVVAALALHGYMRLAPADGTPRKMIADANRERPSTTAAIMPPPPARPGSGGTSKAPRAFREAARETTGSERRAAKSTLPEIRPHIERARDEARSGLPPTWHTPSHTGINPAAPAVAAVATAQALVTESAATSQAVVTAASGRAAGGGVTDTQPDVSRIEIQTADPNIRIIWLLPAAGDATQPLK